MYLEREGGAWTVMCRRSKHDTVASYLREPGVLCESAVQGGGASHVCPTGDC